MSGDPPLDDPTPEPAPCRSPRRAFHLALVTETWPPEINGVAITLEKLADALRRDGVRVTVARPRQSHESGDRRADGDALLSSIPLPFYPALRLGLPARGRLRAAWRHERPDVVHVATEGFLGMSAVRAARDLGIPTTSSYHTHFDDFARHYGARWLVPLIQTHMRAFHNRTHTTLVPSPDVQRRLEAAGIHNCRVMGRGIDTDVFHPGRGARAVREAWGIGSDDLVLICAGRLAPEKGLDLLVRILRVRRRQDPGARLVLVGDGPMRDALEKEDGVILTGAVVHDEVAPYLAAADLFLFASMTETFGNVLCEAMACGLPTVSFDYAASATHVEDGVSGWKVPFAAQEAFVEAALAACDDPNGRRATGAAAHRSMQAMGWPRIVERFDSVVREAARGGPSPARALSARPGRPLPPASPRRASDRS